MLVFKCCEFSTKLERKIQREPCSATSMFGKNEKLLSLHFFFVNKKLLCSAWLLMRQFTWEASPFSRQNNEGNCRNSPWSSLPRGKGGMQRPFPPWGKKMESKQNKGGGKNEEKKKGGGGFLPLFSPSGISKQAGK